MSVLLQTMMFLLVAALVMWQPTGSNASPPKVHQTPPASGGLATPVIPGNDQFLPPGGGLLPPGGGLLPPGGVLLPPGGVLLPPGGVLLPPGGGLLPPGGGLLPPGGGLLPPVMPGNGVVVPPLIPGDGVDLIPSFIPGIGGIDLPKRKCAGKSSLQCMRSKRNRFAAKICTTLCMIRCGIRRSNVVYSCTRNCANSLSPNSISAAVADPCCFYFLLLLPIAVTVFCCCCRLLLLFSSVVAEEHTQTFLAFIVYGGIKKQRIEDHRQGSPD